MYGKLFDTMYDGTLVEDWRALITFQQMIILCDADGVLDMTPSALSRRTGIPIEHIKAGLEILENPDPYSRTPENEGRRICRLDEHKPWGWFIVNHAKYKALQDADTVREQNRLRKQRQRANQKPPSDAPVDTAMPKDVHDMSRTVTDGHGSSRHTDTDTDTDTNTKDKSSICDFPLEKSRNAVPFSEIVNLYHKLLPELPKVEKLTEARKGYIRQRWLQDLPDMQHWENYFGYIKQSKFLLGMTEAANGRPPFRADLEWISKPANYTKIAEGKYHHV